MGFEWLTKLDYWGWWLIGLALVIIEMLVPGVVFLWLGLAAFGVGIILIAAPEMSWALQIAAFAVLSIVSVIGGKAWLKRRPLKTEDVTLNRRGEQYVGRRFTLDEPIVNGKGKLRVDDTTWRVEGDDLAAGTRVTVTGVDGVVLAVVAAVGATEA